MPGIYLLFIYIHEPTHKYVSHIQLVLHKQKSMSKINDFLYIYYFAFLFINYKKIFTCFLWAFCLF